MSHYAVLVSASNERELQQKLLPYYEYGCDSRLDQLVVPYLEFEDVTAEYKEDYETGSVEMVRLPSGKLCYTWDKIFRISGQTVISPEAYEIPQEYERVNIPFREKYETLGDFIEDWAGYQYESRMNAWGRWHNPNAKWDWYVIGGRWAGLLLTMRGKTVDLANAGDVDWDGIANDTVARNLTTYDRIQKALAKVDTMSREAIQAAYGHFHNGIEGWTQAYFDDSIEIRAKHRKEVFPTLDGYIRWQAMEAETWKELTLLLTWDDIKRYLSPREDFIEYHAARAQTYAFLDLKNRWNQRGEMGWWGADDEGKGTPNYDAVWWEFVRLLPSDQRVYIVDCHI